MRRRFKAIYIAPALALIALMAWAFASPIGSSPDDDFHLASIWCASQSEHCLPGQSAATRVVPPALVESKCYAPDPTKSAACQDSISWTAKPSLETKRGNFQGSYPPVYYAVMHVFVGDNVLVSALVMRLMNVLLFVGLTTALFALLSRSRRSTLIWMWLVTSLPMGFFILASNNPSSWAVIGLGSGWLALLGFMESTGVRKWLLGVVFVVATVMAAGARGDAAVYAVLGILVVFALTVPWKKAEHSAVVWRRYALHAILPVAMAVVCLLLFLSSRQTQAGLTGFSGGGSGDAGGAVPSAAVAGLTGFTLLAYNLLNIPFLIAGNFGEWGLGWLDTALPSIVTFAAIGAVVAVAFNGLGRMWGRKLIAVLGMAGVVWLLPVYVLQQGGQTVGNAVQPRYLLPVIVLLLGTILLGRRNRPLGLSRPQSVLVVAALVVVYLISLHFNLRRYLTGINYRGGDLDVNYNWWWNLPVSPMFVWIIGSLAYTALAIILVRHVGSAARTEVPGAADVGTGDASLGDERVLGLDRADDAVVDTGPVRG